MTDSATLRRRQQLLTQMGITQYELRRPMALKGEVAISLPATVRLVLVTQPQPEHDQPLFLDILRSLSLTPEQVYCLSPEQLVMLPMPLTLPLWWANSSPLPEVLSEHKSSHATTSTASTMPLLTTPILAELAADPVAKKALWQQICHYENNFTLNH